MDAASPRGVIPDSVSDRMRRAGLKATRPRLRVLEVLQAWGGHRTAEDLHAEMLRQGDTLSRASVYNVLHDLSACGLVLLTDAGPGRAYYEAGAPWHHHFVCRGCGGIRDVPCQGPGKPCLESGLGANGYAVDEAQVIFRGYCPACLSKGVAPRHATGQSQ